MCSTVANLFPYMCSYLAVCVFCSLFFYSFTPSTVGLNPILSERVLALRENWLKKGQTIDEAKSEGRAGSHGM